MPWELLRQNPMNDAGRIIKILEPNSGETSFVYNPFGELVYQKDSRGNIYEMTYDDLGRILEKTLVNTDEKTIYTYVDEIPQIASSGYGYGQLKSVESDNGYSYHYDFNELSRMISKTENHPSDEGQSYNFTATMSYNEIGLLSDLYLSFGV